MRFHIYREKQFLGEFLHDDQNRNSVYIGHDPHISGIWKTGILMPTSESPSPPPGVAHPPIIDPIKHIRSSSPKWPIVFQVWCRQHGYELKLVE